MKKEDLFSAIGGLDEETVGAASSRLQKKNNAGGIAGTVIAAVLTLALLVPTVILVGLKLNQKPVDPSDGKKRESPTDIYSVGDYPHAENVTYISDPAEFDGKISEKKVSALDSYETYREYIAEHPPRALDFVKKETFETNNVFFVEFYERGKFTRDAEIKYELYTEEIAPPNVIYNLLIKCIDAAPRAAEDDGPPCTGVLAFTLPKAGCQLGGDRYSLYGSVVYFYGDCFDDTQLMTDYYVWYREPVDPPVTDGNPDLDYALKIYSDLIGKYTEAAIAASEGNLLDINNDGDIDASDYGGVSPLVLYCTDPSGIGYTVKDINGDGIYELMIGGMKGSDDEKIIYALYTMKETQSAEGSIGYEIVTVFVSGERDYYCWIEDHAFGHFSSSGADDSSETVFKFSSMGNNEYPDDLSSYSFAQPDLTPLAKITPAHDTDPETSSDPETDEIPSDVILFPEKFPKHILMEAGIKDLIIWIARVGDTYFGFSQGYDDMVDRKEYFGYEFIFSTPATLYTYSEENGFEKERNSEKHLTEEIAKLLYENMDDYREEYVIQSTWTESVTSPEPSETTCDTAYEADETTPVPAEEMITGYIIDVHDNTSEAYALLTAAESEYLIDYAEETNAAPILDALNGITGWTEVDPEMPYEEYEDKVTFTGLFFSLDSDFTCFYCINPYEKLVTKYSCDGAPFLSAAPLAYSRMETIPEIFAELVGMSENTRRILNEYF